MDLLVTMLAGSRAYGVHNEKSDIDIRGVFVQSKREKMDPWNRVSSKKGEGEDTLYYELSNYLQLVCDQNPNVMEYIWTDEADIQTMQPEWDIIRNARFDLLSRKAKGKFIGFANSTKAKMLQHEDWLKNPPRMPLPKDFVRVSSNIALPTKNMPRDDGYILFKKGYDLALFPYERGTWYNPDGSLRIKTDSSFPEERPLAYCSFNTKEYEMKKDKYYGYLEWVNNRNHGKFSDFERLGYDTKQAYHLIRILRMGKELLKSGVVQVKRPDAEELKAIRRGEFTLEQILSMQKTEEDLLLKNYETSPLPDIVNTDIAAGLIDEVYQKVWDRNSLVNGMDIPSDNTRKLPPKTGRILLMDAEFSGEHGENVCELTEIAFIEMVDGQRTGNIWHSWFNPTLPPNDYVVNLTGQTAEFLRSKPEFKEKADEMLEFIGDSPVIAYNVSSDFKVINNDLKVSGKPLLPYTQMACAQQIARELLGQSNIGLDQVCKILDVDNNSRRLHGALLDADLLTSCMEQFMLYPNYINIQNAWLSKKNSLTKEEKYKIYQASRHVDQDGHMFSFTNREGEKISVEIPYPEDYQVRMHHSTVVILPPGERKPFNPLGPSIVFMDKEGIQMKHLERVEHSEDADETEDTSFKVKI